MTLAEILLLAESAAGPDRALDCAVAVALDGFWIAEDEHRGPLYCKRDAEGAEMHPGQAGDMLVPRYSGSVDAELALIGRALAGWTIAHLSQQDDKNWYAELRQGYLTSYSKVANSSAPTHSPESRPPTLALALLITTIRAAMTQAEASSQ